MDGSYLTPKAASAGCAAAHAENSLLPVHNLIDDPQFRRCEICHHLQVDKGEQEFRERSEAEGRETG